MRTGMIPEMTSPFPLKILRASHFWILASTSSFETTDRTQYHPPQFDIGKSNELTLLDPSGAVVSSMGYLQCLGDSEVSYALDEATGTFVYTLTPTLREAIFIMAVPTEE